MEKFDDSLGLDAQQQHDQAMKEKPELKGSKSKLEALLQKKNGPSLEPLQSTKLDPIASAMEDHPGLTREKAEEMAKAFGF